MLTWGGEIIDTSEHYFSMHIRTWSLKLPNKSFYAPKLSRLLWAPFIRLLVTIVRDGIKLLIDKRGNRHRLSKELN